MTDRRAEVFIDVPQLAAALRAGHPPTLLDVRWALAPKGQTFDGAAEYAAGHLPGAAYVDLERHLAAPASPAGGRHPLPDADEFIAWVTSCGITTSSQVVVYDGTEGTSAARAWWLLRYFNVPGVRILDGGYRAWVAAGLPIETGPPLGGGAPAAAGTPGQTSGVAGHGPSPGLTPGHMPVIDADTAAALAADSDGLLIDARAPERFTGATEPIDPQAGHIPGAVNVPTAQNTGAHGLFKAAREIRELYAAAGLRAVVAAWPVRAQAAAALRAADQPAAPRAVASPSAPEPPATEQPPTQAAPAQRVAVYCGSGVTAAQDIAALASIGVEAALYPGSWSQWCGDPRRPVAVGR
ncbi:MAG: sulfurtransferase [Promicromonosporaceae bacterium]|nr:sulfurtransferase [Promicromonosporaceae bacterium]